MTEKATYSVTDVAGENAEPLRHFRESSDAMRRAEEAERSSMVQRLRAERAVAQSRSLIQSVDAAQNDKEAGKA